jgi:very-short-patch-repair endonuclease
MNKCKNCEKETKNKVYCSTECQHIGYKKIKVDRVRVNCLWCDKEFETLPNKINNGKSKYCSRECKDNHQKKIYKMDGNPAFGNKHTEERKKAISKNMTNIWKTEEYRTKVKNGQEKFFKENGYWMGTDEKSLKKRIETNIEKYGVECIFSLEKYKKIREEICLKKYGKTSLEIAREALKKTHKTSIEQKISNILLEYKIKFESQYDIYYNDNNFKSYDFYLKDFNLLIEADGDYWHANPNKYLTECDLTNVQKINKLNDEFKNDLAKKNGYFLLRFWEEDIKKIKFKQFFLNEIKKYGKKED